MSFYHNERPLEVFTYEEGSDVFLKQWTHLLDCIEKGTPPCVPLIHSVVGMYALDALVASLLQQVNIDLATPDEVMTAFESYLEGE